MGAATARLLAREGATVILMDLDEAAGTDIVRAIETDGGSIVDWPRLRYLGVWG